MALLAFVLSFLVIVANVSAVTSDSVQRYYYEPFPLKPGMTVMQVGLSFTLLPVPLVENEYPTPAAEFQIKHGLSEMWSLNGVLSTNIFSTLLHGGPQWNTAIDRTSIGICGHVGGFYGFISTEGQFDNNSAYAVVGIPMLRIGYRLDAFALSTTFAASYVFVSESSVSGLEAPGPMHTFNDLFCTIALEQPFLRKSQLALGISLSYARTPYQTWLLYNTIDQYLFLPEFFFAVQL
ncbi:MAG: hypothetical protein EHM43_07205 [Ignavibacteriae bacterium]|nr:MAG: hypothetical protein EHM43_07205 [Ignavibacteriota bacterium]